MRCVQPLLQCGAVQLLNTQCNRSQRSSWCAYQLGLQLVSMCSTQMGLMSHLHFSSQALVTFWAWLQQRSCAAAGTWLVAAGEGPGRVRKSGHSKSGMCGGGNIMSGSGGAFSSQGMLQARPGSQRSLPHGGKQALGCTARQTQQPHEHVTRERSPRTCPARRQQPVAPAVAG